MTLSGAATFIISKLDGRHRRVDIQAEFMRRHGNMLFSDDLDRLLRTLDEGLFLAGPTFDAHLADLTRQYREAPCRPLRDRETLGAPIERLGDYLDKMLADHVGAEHDTAGRLAGLVAPHLDYKRGGPCYAAAYRGLADRTDATRFVVLGSNHFGGSMSVVGTRKDFETPFGVVPHDEEFMRRVERRCDSDLCEMEYDHAREHSIELQAILLKHILGDRAFVITPYLCPDPCGPTGTVPADGRGVDLQVFAEAVRAELESDDTPTCIIAGADLSHVGRFFHDDRGLDADNLHAVETNDRTVLQHVVASDPEALRATVADAGNPTNICGIGCIYALATILNDRARPRLLHYHQAVTREAENCVTCTALEFIAPS